VVLDSAEKWIITNGDNNMRKSISKITLAATLGFALAFTFSCSSDDDGGKEQGGVSSTEVSSSSAGTKKSSSSGAVNGSSSSIAEDKSSSSSVGTQSSSSQPSAGSVKKEKISGFSQKGPFTKGSAVTLSELNDKLAQTGRSFEEMITDDKGSFEIKNVELVSPYVLLKVNGFYRNEVTGKISTSLINLYAIADIREKSNVNVNILTHLEYYRVQKLVEGGKSLKDAKKQAQNEILAVFGISGEFKDSEDMSIFGTTDGDAALLAISVLLQGNLTEGQFTERLADFSLGFRETGTWDNKEVKEAMADWAVKNTPNATQYCRYDRTSEYPDNCWPMPTDDNCEYGTLVSTCSNPNIINLPSMIRNNILSWNLSTTIPDFEKYLNNYWSVNYGLGICNASSNGSIKKSNKNVDYICKDNVWIFATQYDKDTYQWLCKEGEIKDGQVSGTKYICKNKDWVEATEYEIDTYQWVCTEGEIKAGQASGTKYICKNKAWKIAIKCDESKSCQTFTDTRDNQSYYYVKIGEQTWMAENLNYNAKGSSCYSDNPATCAIGKLYDWETSKAVCPNDWHLPSQDEWETLQSYIKMDKSCGGYCYVEHLCSTNGNGGLDSYGFSILSSGGSNWWSATEVNASSAHYQFLYCVKGGAKGGASYIDKSSLFSVRCLKD